MLAEGRKPSEVDLMSFVPPPSFAFLMANSNTGYLNALAARAQLRQLQALGFGAGMASIVRAGFQNALSALANTVLGSGIPSVAPVSVAFGTAGAPAPGLPLPSLPDGFPILPAFVPYAGFESPALFNTLLGQYNLRLIERANAEANLETLSGRFQEAQNVIAGSQLLGPMVAVFAP